MKDQIESLLKEALGALKEAKSDAEVRDIEIKYLGRKGPFTDIMRGLKDLSVEEKKTIGKLANMTKGQLEAEIQKKFIEIESQAMAEIADKEWMDMTIPGLKPDIGHRHIISKFIDDLEDIFARMGFAMAEGPEIETEHYNFNQLNVAEDHPARDMQDTFWLKNLKKSVLRTQTSPVQIRHMEANKPPIRIVSMGKTFRKDSDATHSPMFHQCEGLMVGESISIADLKGVMTQALQQIFDDPSIKTRFRTSYFPFVEPGLEVDCTCPICHGSGKTKDGLPCRLCKQCGWLEIAGAGMVHPQVLENVGYDPEKLTGFAFGMGLDRMAMIKYRVTHLRLLFENDLRFISQF